MEILQLCQSASIDWVSVFPVQWALSFSLAFLSLFLSMVCFYDMYN